MEKGQQQICSQVDCTQSSLRAPEQGRDGAVSLDISGKELDRIKVSNFIADATHSSSRREIRCDVATMLPSLRSSPSPLLDTFSCRVRL